MSPPDAAVLGEAPTEAPANGSAAAPVPCDLRAEEAIIDGLLLRPTYLPAVRAVVRAVDFYRPYFAQVFSTLTDLADDGRDIDYLTAHRELVRRGVHADDHDICRLYDMATPSSRHVLDHAGIVAAYAKERRLLAALRDAEGMLRAGRLDAAGAVLRTALAEAGL